MLKGFSYLTEEVDSFLDLLEKYLPISSTAWESIAEVHLMQYPNLKRSVDSLKQKFKELHNKKNPTGDPLCPPAVRRAKRLRVAIILVWWMARILRGLRDQPIEGGAMEGPRRRQ